MYTAPLRDIQKAENIERKAYADDNNAFITFETYNEEKSITNLLKYLSVFQSWMNSNMLKFNESKTEIIVFSQKKDVHKFKDFSLSLGESNIKTSSSVKNLGVYLDNTLSMKRHINEKSKLSHFQIRNIWTIRRSLNEFATKSLVNALVIPKIDYCNSLLFGTNKNLISKFERVQNSAARLIKRSGKRHHITPHLKDLHWLPVKYRIHFKIVLMVFKSLHGQAPEYVDELLSDFIVTRSDNLKLKIPEDNLKRTGGRAFSSAAPALWNQLPIDIRQCETVSIFKKKLKAFYFQKHFNSL